MHVVYIERHVYNGGLETHLFLPELRRKLTRMETSDEKMKLESAQTSKLFRNCRKQNPKLPGGTKKPSNSKTLQRNW